MSEVQFWNSSLVAAYHVSTPSGPSLTSQNRAAGEERLYDR